MNRIRIMTIRLAPVLALVITASAGTKWGRGGA